MRKTINPNQRRHLDYLRRKAMKAGQIYSARLLRLRKKELRRVLDICLDYGDKTAWSRVIDNNLSEIGYMKDWHTGLYLAVGMPQAESVTRDLTRNKASNPGSAWDQALQDYATRRAGENIVIVSGTFKDQIRDSLNSSMSADPNMTVERLAKQIYKDSVLEQMWQCRRIAQTETMIGLAEGGALAAQTLGVRFLKQWAISGVGNTRETHREMDGIIIEDIDYFQLADCRMRYPHDTSTNPPAGEIINCSCDCLRIPK